MTEPKIRVVVCRQDQPPTIEEIDNTLQAQQAVVGGLIEVVALSDDPPVDLICDEEFRLKGKPFNRLLAAPGWVRPLDIGGDFFICGADHETGDFASLTPEQAAYWRSFVATSLTYDQAIAAAARLHAPKVADAPRTHCALCRSDKMAPEDFRDDVSRREVRISGTCQRCQDELFKAPDDA